MLAVVLALPGLSLGPLAPSPSGSRHAQPRHQQPRLCAPSAQLSGFLDEVQQSLSNGSLVKLTLSGNDAQQRAAEDDPLHRLKRIEGRSVQLKKGLRLQLTLKYEYRDTCVNVKLPELGESLAGWLRPGAFRRGRRARPARRCAAAPRADLDGAPPRCCGTRRVCEGSCMV